MAFTTAQVEVNTTATLIYTGAGDADVWVRPAQPGARLWVGPSGVTTATGYPVHGELHLTAPGTGDDLYGVTDHAGGILVRTLVQPAGA